MVGKPLLVKNCWYPVETMSFRLNPHAASRYGQNSALMRQGVSLAPAMNAVEEPSAAAAAAAAGYARVDPHVAAALRGPNAALMPGYRAPVRAPREEAPAEEAPAAPTGLWRYVPKLIRNCFGPSCPNPKSEGGRRQTRQRRQRRQSRRGRGRQTRNRFQ